MNGTSMPGGVQDRYGHLRLGKDLEDLMSAARACVEELARLTQSLPPVVSKGHLKVLDAENWHTRRETAAKRRESERAELRPYVGALNRGIKRWQRRGAAKRIL